MASAEQVTTIVFRVAYLGRDPSTRINGNGGVMVHLVLIHAQGEEGVTAHCVLR